MRRAGGNEASSRFDRDGYDRNIGTSGSAAAGLSTSPPRANSLRSVPRARTNSPYGLNRLDAAEREGVRSYTGLYRELARDREARERRLRETNVERRMLSNLRERYGLSRTRDSAQDLPNIGRIHRSTRAKPEATSAATGSVNSFVNKPSFDPNGLDHGGASTSAFDSLGRKANPIGEAAAGIATVFGYSPPVYGTSSSVGSPSYGSVTIYSSLPYVYAGYSACLPLATIGACYAYSSYCGLSDYYSWSHYSTFGTHGWYWGLGYCLSPFYGYHSYRHYRHHHRFRPIWTWRYWRHCRPAFSIAPFGLACYTAWPIYSYYYADDAYYLGDTYGLYFDEYAPGVNWAGPESDEAPQTSRVPLGSSELDAPAPNDFCRGWSQLRRGEFLVAAATFHRTRQALPESSIIDLFSGLAMVGTGEYAAAAARFESAVERDLAIPSYRLDPANHFEAGVFAELRERLERTTVEQPSETSPWICLAVVAQLTGDRDVAARAAAESLLFNEPSGFAREILRGLAGDRDTVEVNASVQAWLDAPSCETIDQLGLEVGATH